MVGDEVSGGVAHVDRIEVLELGSDGVQDSLRNPGLHRNRVNGSLS